MDYDALPIVYSVLSERWADFQFKKTKKIWARETSDRVLLMVQCQGSRWGGIFYLNYGLYYLDIKQIAKPMANLPKPSDWHLTSRYESFRNMSSDEYNALFDLEEKDETIFRNKCIDIASYSQRNIFPKLEMLGHVESACSQLEELGDKAFAPFNTQMVARKDISNYIQQQFLMRSKSRP